MTAGLFRLLSMVLLPAFCLAQGVTGTITGVVTDPSDAVVPGAAVAAKNTATSSEYRTASDPDGYYRLRNLPAGEYTLEVEAKGFRKATLSADRLSVGEILRRDVKLEIGPVTETVTVQSLATAVNTEDAQLGKVVRDPARLPLLSGPNGRNALFLAATQPGIAFAGQFSSQDGGRFSANGQRVQSNNYMFDGTDSNDLAANTPDSVHLVSPNALAEFRIVTGAMKSEYGRNPGSVIQVVTRSGANEFHGGAAEFFRNTKLNAVPFFQKSAPGGTREKFASGFPRKPQWNSNDFDARVGGPIVREKSFFFVSYLGFRRRQGESRSATVFNDAERAAIQANGTAAAKALLALIPPATSGNTLFSSPSNARTRDQGLARFDHQLRRDNRLSVTYFIDDMSLDSSPFAFGGSSIPGFGANTTQRFQNIILADTHTFSPTLLNELRISYHRNASVGNAPQNHTTLSSLGLSKVIPDDPAAEGPPWVIVSGYSDFGNTIMGPQGRADNTFQYLDNMSWTRGRHLLKFGGEFRTYAQNQMYTFINNGYVYIDGSGSAYGIVPQIPGLSQAASDFANGFATFFAQNSASRPGYRTRSANLFVQEDWKVRPRFTLNLGLRWEYNTGLKELGDRVAAFRQGRQSTVFPDAPTGMVFPGDQGISRSTYGEDLNNFGPRAGFAWDVLGTGRLSVRGGYGLFYDTAYAELTLPFITTAPFSIQPFTAYTRYADPWESAIYYATEQPFPFKPVERSGSFDFTSIAPVILTVMDPDFATPYSQQWNLQLQYQLPGQWIVDAGYAGSNGVKLLNRRNINYAIAGPGANSGDTDSRRVINQDHPQADEYGGAPFSAITNQLTDANSNYSSLQFSATKRFSGGLQMSHSYTWAHAIDNISGLRGAASRSDSARADRGNSDHDVRHRYVMTYLYELPWMKNRRGALGMIAGGWGVSGVTTFQTGLVFDITETTDRCLCDSSGQRPDFVGGNVRFYDPRSTSAVSGRPNSWFDGTGGGSPTASANPFFRRVGSGTSYESGAGRFGNLGRNLFHGPGINNWDIAVFKNFRVTERQNLEFRTEYFNAFNHTQFLNPAAQISSVNFGRITTTRDPRILQFSLMYAF